MSDFFPSISQILAKAALCEACSVPPKFLWVLLLPLSPFLLGSEGSFCGSHVLMDLFGWVF
jgi:hypothetical protein